MIDLGKYRIDRAWCISLNRRVDRWVHFKNLADDVGLIADKYEAIDGQTLNVSNEFEPFKGAIGCRMSHLNVIRSSLLLRYRRVMVLEDDCMLPQSPNTITDFLDSLPPDWDWVNFYKPEDPDSVVDHGKYITSSGALCCHMHVMSRRFMNIIMDNLPKELPSSIELHIDQYILRIARQKQIVCYSPPNFVDQNWGLISDNNWGYPDIQKGK